MRTSGDPVSLDGSLIRVDPATGAGLPGNPLASSTDPNARRIISHGFRNPFRFTARPGTDRALGRRCRLERWEEINVVQCWRGNARTSAGPATKGLAGKAATTATTSTSARTCTEPGSRDCTIPSPITTMHGSCRTRRARQGVPRSPVSSSSSPPPRTPIRANTTMRCSSPITPATASGRCRGARTANPRPDSVRGFVSGAANPVNLENGPGGDLFYVDFDGGTIRRITVHERAIKFLSPWLKATPTTGSAPLTVNFDGTGSSDPDAGDVLSYAWDLDADGAYDDSTLAQPS